MIIAAGIIFAIIGLVVLVMTVLKKSRCTAITTGKVVEISRELGVNSQYNGNPINNMNQQYNGFGGQREINLYPIFEYTIGENKYVKKSKSSSYRYHVGQDVTVHYNPENPDESYINGTFTSMIGGVIFMIIGIIIAVVSAIA